MTEKNLTSLFAKYLKDHPRDDTETYELKMVKAKSFNTKTVKEHQVVGLLTSIDGLWHKISDSPIFAGMNSKFTKQKPFDAVWIMAKRAYVVPVFYQPHKYKKAFLIPVQHFITFENKSIKMVELERMNFESFYL